MTVNDIIRKLSNVKPSANGWTALCPVHSDTKRSLSIADRDGKILLNCFAGCNVNSIASTLGFEMSDLFERSNGGYLQPTNSVKKRTIAAVYDYTDEQGEVIYQNVRYNDKTFSQRQPDGKGGYVWNLKGVNPVPYRLPEMIEAAKRDDAEIWLCEGEKDADNVRALGFTASNFKKWQSAFNQYIKTAHVVLFSDHDTAGVKQANDAAKLIDGHCLSLKVIDLFESELLPAKHGKDISDWIDLKQNDGLSDEDVAERLSVIVENADLWKSEDSNEKTEWRKFKYDFTTLDDLYSEPEETAAYVWDRTFPAGGFSIISAKPKVGKSTFARNLTVAISRGELILGRETLKGKVLYLCLEEKRAEVRKHFQMMQADGDAILIHSGTCPQSIDEAIEALSVAIAELDPVIIFIDPLSRVLRGADFNDYQITYKLEPFIDLARKTGVHICALHHDGKGERDGGDAILGSTAIFGAVDCHLSMKKRQHGRTLSSTQRYGEDLQEIVIELDQESGLIIDKGDLQTAILEAVKNEILDTLPDNGELLSETDIKDRIKGQSGSVKSKAIRSLFEENKLLREGEGKRGNPFLYGKMS